MSANVQKALAYLNRDVLRHLVHLKYLSLYSDRITVDYDEQGQSVGVLLSYPTALTAREAAAYPQTKCVLLPTASDEAAALRLVEKAKQLCASDNVFVSKFCDSLTCDVFATAFQLQFAKAVISYTTEIVPPGSPDKQVVISDTLDEACLPLYVENGYSVDEVRHLFDLGAVSFTIYHESHPLSTCFTYQNAGAVWEIGGVHTIGAARRQGLAQRVVENALRMLLEQGRIPRYQLEEHNSASAQLAERLGMRVCLRFRHYLVERES